jgi:hypothetical protein
MKIFITDQGKIRGENPEWRFLDAVRQSSSPAVLNPIVRILSNKPMRYLHKASNKQIDQLINSGSTIGDLKAKYIQPDWCGYHDATDGPMGCWSLMDLYGLRKRISPKFCQSCDCFKRKR